MAFTAFPPFISNFFGLEINSEVAFSSFHLDFISQDKHLFSQPISIKSIRNIYKRQIASNLYIRSTGNVFFFKNSDDPERGAGDGPKLQATNLESGGQATF